MNEICNIYLKLIEIWSHIGCRMKNQIGLVVCVNHPTLVELMVEIHQWQYPDLSKKYHVCLYPLVHEDISVMHVLFYCP